MIQIKVGFKRNGKWVYRNFILNSISDFASFADVLDWVSLFSCCLAQNVEKITLSFKEVKQ